MKGLFSKVKTKILSKKRPLVTAVLLALVVLGYQNCQKQTDQFFVAAVEDVNTPIIDDGTGGDRETNRDPASAVNQPSSKEPEQTLCANGSTQDLICNPLGGGPTTTTPTTTPTTSASPTPANPSGGGGTTTPQPPADIPAVPVSKLGLIAQLYEGQNKWNTMDLYLNNGYKHQEYIYFSNFNVPDRQFTQGFGFGEKDYLKNRHGDKLVEWFAIQAKGNIVLPENEVSGSYHIVTISDDGIRVKIGDQMIINNPGTHSPTIDCANSLVQFNSQEEKSFELTYFQGPRTQIALMTFIKRIDNPATFKKSILCSTKNGPATLVKEGYKVISPAWFTLPAGF